MKTAKDLAFGSMEVKSSTFEQQCVKIIDKLVKTAGETNVISDLSLAGLFFRNFESRWKTNSNEEKVSFKQNLFRLSQQIVSFKGPSSQNSVSIEKPSENKRKEYLKLRKLMKRSSNFESLNREFWNTADKMYNQYEAYDKYINTK